MNIIVKKEMFYRHYFAVSIITGDNITRFSYQIVTCGCVDCAGNYMKTLLDRVICTLTVYGRPTCAMDQIGERNQNHPP